MAYPTKPLRRGQLITPWGVGAIVNFPNNESLMIGGLDIWEYPEDAETLQEFIIKEDRLAQWLGVSHFRLPHLKIPCVRFPRWHYCPRCGLMAKLSIFGSGRTQCKDLECQTLPTRRKPRLIPVRFIAVCEHGHIEDFPFRQWLFRENDIDWNCDLRLKASGRSSTLVGIEISTVDRKFIRTMAGAFGENSLQSIKKCSGLRPWLGEKTGSPENCGLPLQTAECGASNVYFPEVRSSIFLPTYKKPTSKIEKILKEKWDVLSKDLVNGELNRKTFELIAEYEKVSFDSLYEAAQNKLIEEVLQLAPDSDSQEFYRQKEYNTILSGKGSAEEHFLVTKKSANEYDSPIIKHYFKSIVLLHKFKETRALAGFSRVSPETQSSQDKKANLSRNGVEWLPAVIFKGEGIFFEFDEQVLATWQTRPTTFERFENIRKNYNAFKQKLKGKPRPLNPKMVMLHTLAHILIHQFSFDCGYGSAALRERIYCDAEFPDRTMNGILVYTASSDSEGSLGGLVRQGKPGNLEDIVGRALDAVRWCSSDPICIESQGQGPDSCNRAACHNCVLLPETSCEEGNRLLDRGFIVGTPQTPEIGLFTNFL